MEIHNDNNDEYNPLSKLDISTLGKIYSGKRNLSQRAAIAINSHLDKSTFHNYLMDFPTDTTISIMYALQEKQIEITNDDPIEACTNLFVSIIQDCTNKKKQINPQNSDRVCQVKCVSFFIFYQRLYTAADFCVKYHFKSIPETVVKRTVE